MRGWVNFTYLALSDEPCGVGCVAAGHEGEHDTDIGDWGRG